MVHRLLLCAIALNSLPSSDALHAPALARPINAARLPPLLTLRGGGKELTTQPTQTQKKVDAKRNKLKLYLMCAAIAASWFVFATLFFSRSENWPLAQSFFFTVDTGMGIGFGAVEEQLQRTRVFTIINALVGASAVGGALALFADNIVAESSTVAAQEFASAALNGAFTRADTSGDGQLGRDELKAALKDLDVAVGAQDLDEAMKKFDTNGDGSLSAAEFSAAVRPHLVHDGEEHEVGVSIDIASAIRRAIERRAESPISRAFRGLLNFLTEHMTLVVWFLYIAGGAAWGMLAQGWDLIKGIHFAVGSLSTGGLDSPALTPAGTIPDPSAIFIGVYCYTGIPIFAMALGKFANTLIERELAEREQRALNRYITADEFNFAEQLFTSDGRVDLAEFLALELLRMGKVDAGTLSLLKAEFERRDADKSGYLSREEATGLPAKKKKRWLFGGA